MRPAVKLDPKAVDAIVPGPIRIETRDQLVDGLRLITQAAPSGKKSWAVRYTFKGKKYKCTLGKWPQMTVLAARNAAKAVWAQLEEGKNPAHAPVITDADGVVQNDNSIEAMIALYDRTHITPLLRPSTQRKVRAELARAADVWAGRDVKSITKPDVLALTDAALKRGVFAKNQTIKTLQAFFRWLEEDRGAIDFSPARGIRKAPNTKHDRVLGDGEIRMLWQKASEINGRFGAFIKLLLLTGCRRREIGDLEWAEVGEDAIRLPATRTKTKAAHLVHLTPLMKSIIGKQPRKGTHVLGNGKGPLRATSWIKKLLGDCQLNQPWRMHDLRHTVRTNLSRLGVPREVAEACLNHQKRGLVGTYDHHTFEKEKAAAFEKWSAFVEKLVLSDVQDAPATAPTLEVVS